MPGEHSGIQGPAAVRLLLIGRLCSAFVTSLPSYEKTTFLHLEITYSIACSGLYSAIPSQVLTCFELLYSSCTYSGCGTCQILFGEALYSE